MRIYREALVLDSANLTSLRKKIAQVEIFLKRLTP
jgi:hypothetical protein